MMTKNPTMELLGRASTSCDTGYFLSTPRVLVRNFGSSLEEYRRLELAWKAAVGTDGEETAVKILNEQFLRLLAFPCLSPEMLVTKVGTILADAEMTEWLGNDEEAVRVLLSSLLCVTTERGGHRPAFQAAVNEDAPDMPLSETIVAATCLLKALLVRDADGPRLPDRYVVAELVEGAVAILTDIVADVEELEFPESITVKRWRGDN